MEFTKLVRGFVSDLRTKIELAVDRRRRAKSSGEANRQYCPAVTAEQPSLKIMLWMNTDTFGGARGALGLRLYLGACSFRGCC